MTRQEALYALLAGDQELRGLGVEEVRRSGAYDDPDYSCFVVVSWSGDLPAFKTTSSDRVTVWVYDTPGSYDRVDAVCLYLRDALTGRNASPVMEYNGTSGDLYDDQWERVGRNITFTVV